MEFDSEEQFAALCFMYTYKSGFQFHVRPSDLLDVYKDKGIRHNGAGDNEAQFHMMKRIRLVCTKVRTSKTDPEHVPCKVFVDGRIKFGRDKFVITQCYLVHNHEVDPSTSRHVSNYRHIGEYFKKRMMLNDRARIPMTRNFNTLVLEGGGYENIPFNYRDMRNAINQERRKGRENPEFYFAVQKDVNRALLNIFWADARCRAMYKAFDDPVSYDTTFLSNRYLMPFSPFVGVNHQGSTVIFASALVSYEDTETFEWVFENGGPEKKWWDVKKTTLTDEGHLYCDWREFKDCLYHVVNAVRRNGGEVQFATKFVVTEACEQSNRYFKSFVSIETGLKQFIDQYEFALKRKAEEENLLNFADKNRPLKWDQGILFEDVFHKVYTNKKFQEVKDEVYGCINTNVETLPNILGPMKMFRATSKVNEPFWKKERRSFDISIDTVSGEYKCGCKLFEFKGIVCRHIIKCLDVLGVKVIPDKYILARWRMDLVRGYENIRVGYYDPGQSERVKRSVELTVRSDYMTTLAMHDDEAYHIYMTKTRELIKTLEAHTGIENIDGFGGYNGGSQFVNLPKKKATYGTRRIGGGTEEGVCQGNQREEKRPRQTPTRSRPRRQKTSLLKSAVLVPLNCADHS
ncbi:hypothetical protein RND81_03G072000 [Saponaria officinalis]|uniref:SWIM-type domain-containing protein n=1 Tax=Saponaria officinalis TaxID=3572 RepID=A0AAW1M3A2_SAPOF